MHPAHVAISGGDQRTGAARTCALENREHRIVLQRQRRRGDLQQSLKRRSFHWQRAQKGSERCITAFHLGRDGGLGVADIASERQPLCETEDERTKSNPLNNSPDLNLPSLVHLADVPFPCCITN